MSVRRFDSSRLSNVRRTPTGGVIVECAATRCGIFIYTDTNGKTIREYRPPEEVFAAASLATLKGAAVTEKHPPVMVNPDNWSIYSRGNVVEDSIKRGTDNHVILDLAVNAADTIRGIDSGALCEASCGYDCDLDNTPGVTPEGEAYDRIQRNIRYNHVALGPKDWARGGNTVCLRLDSKGNQCLDGVSKVQTPRKRTSPMIQLPKIERLKGHVLRIDGVEYRLKTAEGRRQVDAALKTAVDRIKATKMDGRATRADDAATVDPAEFDKIIDALMGVLQMVHTIAAAAGAQAEAIETPPADDGTGTPMEDDGDKVVPPAEDASKKDAPAEGADKEAKMDAAAHRRAEIVTKARQFVPALETTRMDNGKSVVRSNEDIMREALKVARIDTKGMSPGEVAGAFAVIKPHTTHPTFNALAGAKGGEGRTDGQETKHTSGGYKANLATRWQTFPKG